METQRNAERITINITIAASISWEIVFFLSLILYHYKVNTWGWRGGSVVKSSPGTDYIVQAGLELTEIHLPLPPECWD